MTNLDRLLGVTKALSGRNRVRLVSALMDHDELCACQLTELLGVSGATASRHLSVLVGSGLVESRKEGRWMHYRLHRCPPGETCSRSHMLAWLAEELSDDPVIVGDRRLLARVVAGDPRALCRQQRGARRGRRRGERLRILFLCTGNSCRSQMAEGWVRALKGEVIEAYSAGIEAHGLNPRAVRVMGEVGVDISRQRSKLVDEVIGVRFDDVITVCDRAHESCPVFPGRTRIVHVGFADPPKLAESARTEDAKMDCYRRVRDQIRRFVETLPAGLHEPSSETEG